MLQNIYVNITLMKMQGQCSRWETPCCAAPHSRGAGAVPAVLGPSCGPAPAGDQPGRSLGVRLHVVLLGSRLWRQVLGLARGRGEQALPGRPALGGAACSRRGGSGEAPPQAVGRWCCACPCPRGPRWRSGTASAAPVRWVCGGGQRATAASELVFRNTGCCFLLNPVQNLRC